MIIFLQNPRNQFGLRLGTLLAMIIDTVVTCIATIEKYPVVLRDLLSTHFSMMIGSTVIVTMATVLLTQFLHKDGIDSVMVKIFWLSQLNQEIADHGIQSGSMVSKQLKISQDDSWVIFNNHLKTSKVQNKKLNIWEVCP